jgi:L,D-peptidoglycan transpeptidase YkuD (ErfK/YbiS/YcfS/YnhG family)
VTSVAAALRIATFALAACAAPTPVPPPSPTTPTPSPTTPTRTARATAVIPDDARQLVTAIVADWDSTDAELRLWTREAGGAWKPTGAPWQGVIGHAGAAWGEGLHGLGAPRGRTGPRKHEGDGKSPAGVFALRATFGYAAAPPRGAALPYTAVDARWKCVDDAASAHYNEIVDARTLAPDWRSAEDMRRTDDAYRWVVEVAHNPARTAGDGSCIFLHVWHGPGSSTVGCTAMPEDRLAALMAALAPASVFVLLPRAEYDALAPAWHLP